MNTNDISQLRPTEAFQVMEATEKAIFDIETIDELLYRITSQFKNDIYCGVDRTDYIKVYCIKFLKMSEDDFFENWADYITDENREEFINMMYEFATRLRFLFGIQIDLDALNAVQLTYTLYKFFIVCPEQFLLDFLLYNHFYVDGKNFAQWYKALKINEKIHIDMIEDPVKDYDNTKKMIEAITKDDTTSMDYKDRVLYFTHYAKEVILDTEGYDIEFIFDKLNTINPNRDYEYLDKCVTCLFELSFEDKDLLVQRLMERTFNVTILLPYLIENIVNPFFKYLDTFIQTEMLAIADSAIAQ